MKLLLALLLLSLSSFGLEGPLSEARLLNGKSVTTLDTKDKNTVIFFLSASCPCTKNHIPYLQDLGKQYPNFQFLGIHSNANETIESAKKEFGSFGFPIAFDKDMKIADQFKATKTPHVFVVNPKGEILFHGGVTNSTAPKRAKKFYLKNALEDIKNNREVKQKFARALGCYIIR
ncbi:redoxin domain-containing protein [Halobacteriovorax sp.]|uniref:redoxin domain-containing protein n=1 Tax=Halobacteriovorax sp. TaxID=2020862 RepID=UPI003564B809